MEFLMYLIKIDAAMARRPNTLRTVQVTISTTPPIIAYLDQLVPSGLYGKNSAEAAERLLVTAIAELLRDGTLKKKS